MRKHSKIGGDIVSSVISKIPVEFHMRTLTGKKYSFCGPNTNLEERLNPDGTPKPWSKPINKVDEICLRHDLAYNAADKGVGTRHEADKVMLDELKNLNNKDLTWNEYFAKQFTRGVIGLKHKLGLGLYDNLHLAEELHKPITRKFKRRKVFVLSIDDIWSADLKDMQSLAPYNNGYKYLLNVIDLFSRYAYSIPLKSKSSKDIITAFESLFTSSGRHPNKLWTDQGSEFINNNIKKFMKDRNIEIYHVHNEGKAVVVERFNRTIGEKIQKYMTQHGTKKYINALQDIVDDYNSTPHGGFGKLKLTPLQASEKENSNEIVNKMLDDIIENKSTDKQKFKVGDRVRIYRYKKKFEKGSTPNWTDEIFVVDKAMRHLSSDPITYKIKDLNGEDIIGSFYAQELQHSRF